MKIQTKLTLLFCLIFGAILLLFIVGVYHFYDNNSKEEYFERLRLRATLKFDLIEGESIDPEILRFMYENTPDDYEPKVVIYNNKGHLIYHDVDEDSDYYKSMAPLIVMVKKQKEYTMWEHKYQTIGFMINNGHKDYIVFATGYDNHRVERLADLRFILGSAFLVTMLFILLAGRFFAKMFFRPVTKMVEQVKDITSSHLDIRLDERNKKDELAELAVTFNQMLAQLEYAFDSQKQFVSNISHELRTPLSAIITELELAESRNHTCEEYKEVISETMKDARRLVKLSNSLLDMAKANYNPTEISFRELRLDELLLEVCRKIQKSETDYKLHLFFEKEFDDECLISVNGNEYLLSVAFTNIIDNGCKFSKDNTCEIHLSYEEENVTVQIIDHGIGIKGEEKESIFTPFYRGINKTFAPGNGIGLSLTHRIIDIHKGTISIDSHPGFTAFTVSMNHL